jgi:hypothetical protein
MKHVLPNVSPVKAEKARGNVVRHDEVGGVTSG